MKQLGSYGQPPKKPFPKWALGLALGFVLILAGLYWPALAEYLPGFPLFNSLKSTPTSTPTPVVAGPKPPSIRYFVANPNSIDQGETAELTWQVDYANMVILEGEKSVDVTKFVKFKVSPTGSRVYKLIAKGEKETTTASVELTVKPPPTPVPPPQPTWYSPSAMAQVTLTFTYKTIDDLKYPNYTPEYRGVSFPKDQTCQIVSALYFIKNQNVASFPVRLVYSAVTGASNIAACTTTMYVVLKTRHYDGYKWFNYCGWNAPGQWQPGQYRVEAFDGDTLIARADFTIYE